MPTCPNLKALADQRYKVAFETPLDQRPTPSTKADPWAMIVPTRTGHIYPFGTDTLAVFVEGRRSGLVRQLVEAGAKIRTVGTDGTTLVCSVALFDQVAKMTGARRRRKLSPEQRAVAVERLAQYAFQPAAQSGFGGLVCPGGVEVDLGAVQG